jgi:hypothetical protein
VNLPGGCSLASRGGGGPTSFTPVVRSSAQDLTLALDPAMVGAIVSITAGGAESAAFSETVGGRYVMTAADMRELISAGVSDVVLEFVAPNGLWLRVKVTFGEQQKLVVTIF